jgi:hypothetical protein
MWNRFTCQICGEKVNMFDPTGQFSKYKVCSFACLHSLQASQNMNTSDHSTCSICGWSWAKHKILASDHLFTNHKP